MPIRGKNLYGRKKVMIPLPKFVVFYNGNEDQPEQYELKPSDLYMKHTDDPQLELKHIAEVTKVMELDYTFERQIELAQSLMI